MDRKITRRIALGTILGGLAAGPFVIRALRQNGEPILETELPQAAPIPFPSTVRERYFNEWKSLCDQMAVHPVPIPDAPKTIQLKLDLSQPQKMRFQDVSMTIRGAVSSLEECSPENLLRYTYTEGTIDIPGSPKNILTLCAEKREERYILIDKEASEKLGVTFEEKKTKEGIKTRVTSPHTPDSYNRDHPAGIVEKIVVTPMDVGCVSFKPENDSLYRTNEKGEFLTRESHKVSSLIESFFTGSVFLDLCYPFPTEPLNNGSCFEIPIERVFSRKDIPNRGQVKTIQQIEQFMAAKIIAELSLDCDEYQDYIRKQYHLLIEKYKTIYNEDQKASLKKNRDRYIRSIAKDKQSFFTKLVRHVDLATGLTIHHETIYRAAQIDPNTNTDISIFRIV